MTKTMTKETMRLPVSEILQLPWQNLHAIRGASTKVLWRAGESFVGILLLEPGTSLGEHVHEHGQHFAYVLEGRCRMDGELLTEGSFIHVPAAKAHEVLGERPDGCRVLYMFLGE